MISSRTMVVLWIYVFKIVAMFCLLGWMISNYVLRHSRVGHEYGSFALENIRQPKQSDGVICVDADQYYVDCGSPTELEGFIVDRPR